MHKQGRESTWWKSPEPDPADDPDVLLTRTGTFSMMRLSFTSKSSSSSRSFTPPEPFPAGSTTTSSFPVSLPEAFPGGAIGTSCCMLLSLLGVAIAGYNSSCLSSCLHINNGYECCVSIKYHHIQTSHFILCRLKFLVPFRLKQIPDGAHNNIFLWACEVMH